MLKLLKISSELGRLQGFPYGTVTYLKYILYTGVSGASVEMPENRHFKFAFQVNLFYFGWEVDSFSMILPYSQKLPSSG